MEWHQYSDEELREIAARHYQELYGKVETYIKTSERDILVRMLDNLNTYAHAIHKHFSDGIED